MTLLGMAVVSLLLLTSCLQLPLLAQQETQAAETVAAEPEPAPPSTPKRVAQEKPASSKTLWEWTGDGRKVTHIWVDIDQQRARFYDGEEQIGWSYVASGLKSHPTPTGQFEVLGKESKKRSNLYGKIYSSGGKVVKSNAKQGQDRIPAGGRFVGAKMPYFMRLTHDGVGLHAGRIPRPGSPASHGCIRMPKEVAPILYRHVGIGTPVTITGQGPSYGNYVQKQRQARAARLAAERQKSAETEARLAAQDIRTGTNPAAVVEPPLPLSAPDRVRSPGPLTAAEPTAPLPDLPAAATPARLPAAAPPTPASSAPAEPAAPLGSPEVSPAPVATPVVPTSDRPTPPPAEVLPVTPVAESAPPSAAASVPALPAAESPAEPPVALPATAAPSVATPPPSQ